MQNTSYGGGGGVFLSNRSPNLSSIYIGTLPQSPDYTQEPCSSLHNCRHFEKFPQNAPLFEDIQEMEQAASKGGDHRRRNGG